MFVRLAGQASVDTVNKILKKSSVAGHVNPFDFYFLDYSDFSIPVNTVFYYFAETKPDRSVIIHNCQIHGKIALVTQEFGVLFNQIPFGHKTICQILLDEPSHSILKNKIPVIDYWNASDSNFFLSTTELTLDKIKVGNL